MDEAEKIGPSAYFENCLGCLTGYLSLLCMETHYDKVSAMNHVTFHDNIPKLSYTLFALVPQTLG